MLAGHRCTLESDVSKFLFGKCPAPNLKAEYTYTLSCISQSRCQKTLLRYNAHWFRFRSWCQQNKLSFLPADPMHVAMFLSNSLRFALNRGLTYSNIKAASAAILTALNMAGLDDVTSHSFVQAVRSCAQRSLSSGGQFRKAPLSLDLCTITVSFLLQPSQSTLLNLQIATFIMVCFSGFLRYDCACQIFADEVRFYSSHMEIFLAKRKNDQFRSGSVVCIAQGKSLSCPVSLLKSLLVKAGSLGKHVPFFRSFRKGSSEKFCPSNQPWSYSFARARVLQALADSAHMSFADFTARYGLHSLRSEGATLVAKEGVPDHIFQAHGAWRSSQAMHAYIERPTANKLLPTRAMHY